MADTSGPEQCGILKEINMYVEVIQRLVKGHDHQNNLQELGHQVCKTSESDKCGHSSSLSTISRHIDIIQQVINVEKTNSQSSLYPIDQHNTAEEASAIESDSTNKALNNSVVLRTIMSYLGDRDLLRCRLVSKLWEEEATVQLLSSYRSNQVKFKWDRKQLKYQNKVGTLGEFTDSCFGNPLRKFPCSQFYFEDESINLKIDDAPEDLSNFFSNHGHHIKSLTLDSLSSSASSLNIVRKIIFEWTPCLQSLTISNDRFHVRGDKYEPPAKEIKDKSNASSSGNSPKLLSLEHLELSCNLRAKDSAAAQRWSLLIHDILSSATNLKVVSDDKLWFTKEIISAGKIRADDRLVWDIFPRYMMKRVDEFSKAQPQLTFLQVDLAFLDTDDWRESGSNALPILQLLLQSSRDTLKTLKINGHHNYDYGTTNLDIPVMEKLQSFFVDPWILSKNGQGKLLSEGFSLQKSFPQLKFLSIGDFIDTEMEKYNPFDRDLNSSTTVQELSLRIFGDYKNQFEALFLSQAPGLYPNVRVLHLEIDVPMGGMPEICRALWGSWNESLLEELSITRIDEDYCQGLEIMDQALTGFDQETCKLLKRDPGLVQIEEFERGPSIVNMKNLKLFKLTECIYHQTIALFPFFSRVSLIHAFEPMRRRQDLKVLINGVDLNNMIQHGLNLDFSITQNHVEFTKK